jgi:hypothetical protein
VRASLKARIAQQTHQIKKSGESDWQLWEPYPVQKLLLDSKASLIGFGGSAGGSKSTAGLFAAYLQHRKTLILRRTYANLKELIERSREMFSGSGGSFNGSEKLWRFPGGKLIEFGHVQFVKDKENHKGREKDALIVDEVTELPGGWETLRYLMGWVRSPDPRQRCQTIVTFNPPTQPSEEWVKAVFAPWIDPDYAGIPADSGEIRWFAMIDGEDVEVNSPQPFEHEGDLIEPVSRTFIRATLQDNAALKNSDYRQRLKALPEPLRSQLLYGDMSIQLNDDPWQVVPTEWVQLAMARWTDAPPMPMTSAGVDVARGGKDESIIFCKHGHWFAMPVVFPGASTPDGPTLATQVVKTCRPGAAINIDVVGVGSSVFDILKGDCNVTAISAGSSSDYVDKTGSFAFRNLRAELLWRVREALDPESNLNWALPPDPKLKAELCAPRYFVKSPTEKQQIRGVLYQIQVESKDEIKERLGRSPDRADALTYAAWEDSRKVLSVVTGGVRRG